MEKVPANVRGSQCLDCSYRGRTVHGTRLHWYRKHGHMQGATHHQGRRKKDRIPAPPIKDAGWELTEFKSTPRRYRKRDLRQTQETPLTAEQKVNRMLLDVIRKLLEAYEL